MNKSPARNTFLVKMFLTLWVLLTASALLFFHFTLGMTITRELLSKAAATYLLSSAAVFFLVYLIKLVVKNSAQD
ncbi:hypothetical protein ACFFJT_07955 [Dyella flava]|uniref:Uncharacterized protein n=1 Tax=Dyella flava TaxID=1920170 RepID=A0ABS2K8P8_9GAMM|nr:hypothetical protein [Dyella flava]MBM7127526.1 hypothetical protein [Dyella flava]GLQ51125.1 hypothetical protein GCM10010872_25740 [Dyella flava]